MMYPGYLQGAVIECGWVDGPPFKVRDEGVEAVVAVLLGHVGEG